jgi:hypothetical protein
LMESRGCRVPRATDLPRESEELSLFRVGSGKSEWSFRSRRERLAGDGGLGGSADRRSLAVVVDIV